MEWLEPRQLLAVDFAELARLLPTGDLADTSHADDQFGYAVAVDGDTAVVGAPEDEGVQLEAGAAYVFTRSAGTWSLQQKLTAGDAAAYDQFGSSVDIAGDTVVVGAPLDDTGTYNGHGSAYVFTRSGGVWTQQQKLTASDKAEADEFGTAVAISGGTVVAGAWKDNGYGSAYVFTRNVGIWIQQQKLLASDPLSGDRFGGALDLDGESLAVGAYQKDVSGKADAGAAYVFVQSGGTWSQQQKLTASDGAAADWFGRSVAVSGDTLLAGAYQNDLAAGDNAGAAYVFTRSGTTWSEQAKLRAADAAAGDLFGWSVAVEGETALVGSRMDDTAAVTDNGSAYVFTRSGSTWSQHSQLTATDPAGGMVLGHAVALSGTTVLAGCPLDDRPETDTGSAYVFKYDGSAWAQQQKLVATDQDARLDAFGTSVAVAGSTVAVGAPGDDSAGSNAGSAYVFIRNGAEVAIQRKLTAPDASAGDQFGGSVAILGDTLVVGAATDDTAAGADAGSAYVFVRSGATWSLQQQLTASDGAAGDYFGKSVALSGETLVVGAYGADIGGSGSAGAAYVFTRSGGVWTQQRKLVAAGGAAADYFGYSVAVSGDTALVGAYGSDVVATGQGTAYVFVRSGTSWSQQAQLSASDAAASDPNVAFGSAVALDGNTALVGAYQDSYGNVTDCGAAYVYVRSGTTWSEQQKLIPSVPASYDQFGRAVALVGYSALIGAPSDDVSGSGDSGSAYLFTSSGTTWSQQQLWTASAAAPADWAGRAVALGAEMAVVGATGSDVRGADAGAAYAIAQLPDYGDAPSAAQSGFAASYPTTLADNGPRHWPNGPTLGAARDGDGDGRPSAAADGDDTALSDDEDGVVWVSPLAPGSTAYVDVTVSAAGKLYGWLDFNSDGDWADSGEAIFDHRDVVIGLNHLSFSVPASAAITARTYARFRVTWQEELTYTGEAFSGEVEDHAVAIQPAGGQVGGRKWSDTDGDGVWDAGELPLAGVTVYLDTDDDGQWDAGEPKQATGADGGYRFTGLAAGDYLVREQVPAGAAQTYPGAAAPETHRASIASDGTQTDGQSNHPTLSAGGRYVAFESMASNLVPGDTNAVLDVFLHDSVTGQTVRISTGNGGAQANLHSLEPRISADGRYVAFQSSASNLVLGDTNAAADVFLYDRVYGTIERVSASSGGVQANSTSYLGQGISGDGRFVTFTSSASNLVTGDTNGVNDVFVRDRWLGLTERVSLGAGGVQSGSPSSSPSISDDGRFVAFESTAADLVAGDLNAKSDIFVFDRQLDTTERVSLASAGVEADNHSYLPSISGDGRYVAFRSAATNLVAGDTNGASDIFVYDRQTDTTQRVSQSAAGTGGNLESLFPTISKDGRYVGFESAASNLIAGDTNGARDVFVYDRQTETIRRVSTGPGGIAGTGNSTYSAIGPDGQYAAYISAASNLVAGDVNSQPDIFVSRVSDEWRPGTHRVALAADQVGPNVDFGNQSSPFHVTAVVPADGALLNAVPPAITVDFSRPVKSASVDAGDLQLDGIGASGVTAVDADTLRFTVPAMGDGPHVVTLPGGVLDSEAGDVLTAFASVFTLDTTAPTVTVDALATADFTPPLTGTVNDVAATVRVTVGGRTYTATNRGDGTWLLIDNTIDPPLANGVYDVVAEATDVAGNVGYDATSNELTVAVPPSVMVAPTSGLTTTEAGGAATFTIRLGNPPTADVTIGLSSSDAGEGVVSPASVTFTAANWNAAQTVTVTGVDDAVDDGDVAYLAVTAAAVSADTGYSGLDAADVAVTNADNDTAGITVHPTAGLLTTEAGGTAGFSLVLNSQPTAAVTIGLASSDSGEGTVAPASVTVTPATWDVPQAVTVTGVNDGLVDGDVGYLIVTAAAASGDPLYDGRGVADVAVTNQDNDPGNWDWGDAPEAYGTSLAADGARHEAFGLRLGTLRDIEPNAATPRDGTGDDSFGQDDEDGVVFTSVLRIGGSATVEVTASAAGVLNAWLDANADNDWSDAGEQVFANQAVLPGVNRLTFAVPAGAIVTSRTYARFRLSTQSGLGSTGWAADGEVEDEAVAIWPWTGEIRGVKWLDVDGDGERDSGEPVLPGWTIFLDENQNGQRDSGEASAVTAADGRYAFTGLEPAEYVVAEELPDDWEQTSPGRPAMSQQRVSVSAAGAQGNKSSRDASLSGDGRYVAFSSYATNLVAGDTNNTSDVFVLDRQSGTTERVNLAGGGVQANQASYAPKLSADGRYVAFISAATNLVTGDTNGKNDVFVVDRQTGVVERVNVSSSGTQANDHGETPAISADGRFVAWMSSATNLVAGDTNGKKDIFVYDRQTATTELASVSSAGVPGNNDSESPALSADGRYVAFDSTASNLVAGDSNFQSDAFVRDRQAGVTQRVSVSSAAVQGNISSRYPTLSSDGRYVAYLSGATNLVAGDTNREDDVFVFDRDTGQVERVSVSASGTEANDYSYYPTLSGDGRFVAYRSSASNLVVGDVNRADDVFVYDRQTGQVRMVTIGWDGSPADNSSDVPALSGDGAWVAYTSYASNLVASDTNGATDVFVNAAAGVWQAGAWTVDLRQVPNAADRDFGNRQPLGSIGGVNWQDADGDGIRDAGESGLADWTIYLDQNGNGQLDNGEAWTVTDAQGQYAFTGLPPGTYRVAESLPAGWLQTSPGGPSSRVVELGAAAPLTFDFEDLAHTGTYDDVGSYQKDGFILTSGRGSGDVFRVYGPQEPSYYTGTAALESVYSGYRISLRREDGLPFTATSVGLSKERSSSTTPTVWLTGIRGLEAAAEQKVTVPNFGIQPFSLTGFVDILALEWTYNQVWDAHQFDDVVVRIRGEMNPADIDFGNQPKLTLVIADDAILETAGGAATTATVTRGGSTAAAVTVSLTSSDPTEATVPATVTILAGQASATFAIAAQDDLVVDGTQSLAITATAAGYVEAADSLSVTDNDTAGITVSRTVGLTTGEAGGADTFSVRLNSQPTANVTIGLTSSDASEGTVSPASVTFTAGNWSTPQTVTVTGVDDDVDDGDVGYTIVTAAANSGDPNYSVLDATDVSVTNTDDDTAGITVNPTGGLVTTESGGIATFAILLNSQPTSEVTIGLNSSDTSEGAMSPASVTFTAGNWSSPQTVTVTGINDVLDDGDVGYTIVTAAANSGDANYNNLNAADVSVTNADDDAAGITVNPTSGMITTESGGITTFTIALTSQPTANVTVDLTSSDAGEGTVSPASVTFTAGNWSSPQTVTVTGINDDVDDGDVAFTIVTAAASSGDADYRNLDATDVSVTNTDNDTAGITVNPTGGLVTTESGGIATFAIVLSSQPTADVTIDLSSSDASEGTVSPASLTFTAGNWSSPQTMTVTGVNDDLDDGDVAFTIATAAAGSADANYNNLNASDVSVTNTDNDAAGIMVNPTGGLVTTESGGITTFTIALTSQPMANVTVDLTSSDAGEGTVSPASVTFTAGNWSSPHTVTVTGINDDVDDGDVAFTIVTAAANSGDANYNNLNAADVSVTNADADTAGITLSPTSDLITTESGGITTFTIALNSQPTADVTIDLNSSDTSEGNMSPASVTFTAGNWSSPQTVTVTGINDDVADGDVAFTIVTASANSGDANYNNLNAADVSVTNADDDTAGITVNPTGGLVTTEAGGTATFTIVLNSQPTAEVTIGLNSSDTSEGSVFPASVTFTAGNWSSPQTVTVTGINDDVDDGDVAFTIVTAAASSGDADYSNLDAANASITNTDDDTAGITVNPTGGLVTTESGGTATFTIALNSQPTADVTIGLNSSDTSEGTLSPASLTFTAGNWSSPQTVTVTGINDDVDDGDVAYTIVTAAANSGDANYHNLDAANVAITNTDDDTAGITVSPTSGLVTTESGGIATFTIVLKTRPTAEVSIGLSSSDGSEGTVFPASVTFTAGNWNVPQTVAVTGVNDDLADGSVGYAIFTAAAVSGDTNYSNLNATDVSVTNTDNDTAGITVSPASSLITTESGGTAAFTIVLNTQPTANVTIGVSSSDTGEGTISPASVTFTAHTWNVPQTVTVTGINDDVDDGDVAFTIVTAAASSGDANYSNLDAADVAITNTDDDMAGITVSPASGLITTESGGTATFTIALNSQPTANVTIGLSSSGTGEGTVSPASVTFTAGNWSAPQTVTVTGVNDDLADGNVGYAILTGAAVSEDANYSNLNATDVSVTNADNDTAGITVNPTGSLVTTETGGIATFTIALNSQPRANVTIGLSSSDASEGAVSPASVTFTVGNWSSPQTVAVTGVNDDVDDGDVAFTIVTAAANSGDANYNNLNAADVSVTNADNDTAGITVNQTSGLVTMESGGTTTFTIVLNTQPAANVTIGLSSSDASEGTVSPASVTFTAANWSTPQTVTVTGVNDDGDDGEVAFTIVTAAASSGDANYSNLDATDVSVTNADNDTAGITVSPTSGLATTESGGTATFTIALNSQPTASVTIGLSSSDASEGTVSPASVTFTAGNWSSPQTVTVTGVNDDVDDGDVGYTIVTVAAASSDANYSNLDAADVSVTNTDNDTAGITVNPASALVTTESGGTATFTIALNSQPTANVTMGLSSSDASEGTVSPASVTFTPGNWSSPQTVIVTGINDDVDDGDVAFTIVTAAANSGDANYSNLDAADVSVTNTDNDTARIMVNPTGGLVTTESGGTATFTIALNSQPTASVTIGLSSSDASEGTVSPASVTFTAGNWSSPQTVTVTGVNDDVDDGDVGYTIVTVAAASSDANYSNLDAADVSVANTDYDAAGITVNPTGGLVTTESGGTATFTIVLNSQPTANVTIGLSSSDASEGTVSPASVTFTGSTWNVPQTVTVTGINDDVDDGDVAFTIVTAAASSGDANYNDLDAADVSVANTDNDAAGITVNPTGGLVTTESGGTATFTIVLNSQPTANVRIDLSSSDASEGTVSPASVTITAGNWSSPQTVTVTGINDDADDGDVAFTIVTAAASSGDANYNNLDAADVSVANTDNDAAGITVNPTGGLVTTESGGTATFTIALNSQPMADVTIGLSSSDGSEGTVSPASVTFTTGNWSSPQTVTVTGINDDADDGDVAFTIVTAAASSGDAKYNNLDAADVSVTNTDNDTAGITVNSASGLTTTESGGTATFTIVLNSQPTADVMIGLVSSDAGEGSVSPASVTFTAGNWRTPQTVTVTGVNDDVDDGDVAYTIVTAAAASADADYGDLDAADIGVVTSDNDTVGVLVTPTNGLVTTEAGGTATFTIVLSSEPVADVTIGLSSSDHGEGTVSPTSVTFTNANWRTPQPVAVAGVNDDVDDGDVVFTIVTGAAASADVNYVSLDGVDVSVTNADDDTAGIEASPVSGLVVTEAGSTALFSVALSSQPETAVVLTVSSGDSGEASAHPAVLWFTPTDWNSPQPVTIRGVDDFDRDGAQVTALRVAVDPSQSDDRFDAVQAIEILVTTVDNDVGWQNARDRFDVDNNGRVNAADVLAIINYINGHPGSSSLPPPPAVPPPFYDVDNDGVCLPNDVLLVINEINRHATAADGEGEGGLDAETSHDVMLSLASHGSTRFGTAGTAGVSMPETAPGIPAEAGADVNLAPRSNCLAVINQAGQGEATRSTLRSGRMRGSRATAQAETASLDAVIQAWDEGVAEDLLAVLAAEPGRCFE